LQLDQPELATEYVNVNKKLEGISPRAALAFTIIGRKSTACQAGNGRSKSTQPTIIHKHHNENENHN
jgi:hypothetical protein